MKRLVPQENETALMLLPASNVDREASAEVEGSLAVSEGEGLEARETWPQRPQAFPDLMTPVEAAQYLRLDETGKHTPQAAVRTLDYFRDRGCLRATKYAHKVWYRRAELERFLEQKTEA